MAITGLDRTSYWPSLENKILFWEALQTQPHEIDGSQVTVSKTDDEILAGLWLHVSPFGGHAFQTIEGAKR